LMVTTLFDQKDGAISGSHTAHTQYLPSFGLAPIAYFSAEVGSPKLTLPKLSAKDITLCYVRSLLPKDRDRHYC
jgi:hypothetical protein